MKTRDLALLGTLVWCALFETPTARAALTLCAKPSGTLAARGSCKKKELSVSLNDLLGAGSSSFITQISGPISFPPNQVTSLAHLDLPAGEYVLFGNVSLFSNDAKADAVRCDLVGASNTLSEAYVVVAENDGVSANALMVPVQGVAIAGAPTTRVELMCQILDNFAVILPSRIMLMAVPITTFQVQ